MLKESCTVTSVKLFRSYEENWICLNSLRHIGSIMQMGGFIQLCYLVSSLYLESALIQTFVNKVKFK